MPSEDALQAARSVLALSDAERERLWGWLAPKLREIKSELRDKADALNREWEREFGEPYPQCKGDWLRWAYRVGWDGEYVRRGDWTYGELMPAIEGRLCAIRDRVRTADSPADNSGNSSRKLPENPDVLRLAKLIRKNTDPHRTQKEIALEFSEHNDKKADNLLRQVRRHRKTLGLADN